MAWIILEGLDRSGKSSVADMYRNRGYEVVHFAAPAKKYTTPGYTGPSYLDEVMDIYVKYANKDVVFDRSPYGETVWPFVYGRPPLLLEDDFEILKEMEDTNQTERLWFTDENTAAHWKRCVDNNEPLTKPQFTNADLLFSRMAKKYDFRKVQLRDFAIPPASADSDRAQGQSSELHSQTKVPDGARGTNPPKAAGKVAELAQKKSSEAQKLEKANAINDILSKRIIKGKGELYDLIEKDVRAFLNEKLASLFGSAPQTGFTPEETQILKMYVQQIKKKMNS